MLNGAPLNPCNIGAIATAWSEKLIRAAAAGRTLHFVNLRFAN